MIKKLEIVCYTVEKQNLLRVIVKDNKSKYLLLDVNNHETDLLTITYKDILNSKKEIKNDDFYNFIKNNEEHFSIKEILELYQTKKGYDFTLLKENIEKDFKIKEIFLKENIESCEDTSVRETIFYLVNKLLEEKERL